MRKPPPNPPPLRTCLLLLLVAGLIGLLPAQESHRERGIPFSRYYPARDYRAHTQNFAATRDARGVVYVANFAGILEFDGVSWRLIRTAGQSKVSSLCTDSSGRIYAGARGEIGVLTPDKQGNMVFTDLTGLVPAGSRSFTEVKYCFATEQGILFITSTSVMIYNEGKVSVIPSGNEILAAFYVNNSLYIQEKDHGLKKLEGVNKKEIPGSGIFTSAIQVTAMLPYKGNTILAATDNQGLFIIDPEGVKSFPTEADGQLKSSRITSGARLGNNELVFGTIRKGMFLLSEQGKLLAVVDKATGLGDDYVTNLYVDRYSGLWVCLNDGVARVEYPSPFTEFGVSSGLNGGVTGIGRFQGRLYVSTYQGLFYYKPSLSGFVAVPQIQAACWAMLPLENMMLAATSQGVFRVNGDMAVRVTDGFFLSLCRSPADPSVIWGGQTSGIAVLEYRQGNVTYREKLSGYEGEGREIAADQQGRLWIIDADRGVLRHDRNGQWTVFDSLRGLPEIRGLHLNTVENDLLFSSPSGVFSFDERTSSFTRHPLATPDTMGNVPWFYRIVSDRRGGFWANAGDEKQLCRLLYRGKAWVRDQVPFLPVADMTIWAMFPEKNGNAWFGGPEGLLRYDQKVNMVYDRDFVPLIREMTLNNDTLVFNGAFSSADSLQLAVQPADEIPVFSHWENTIRLKFAAPLSDAGGKVQYRYMLDGFDKLWSDWTAETQKEYTNLPGGKYTFRVQARDVYGKISKENSYAFQVRKAWYITRGAMAGYVLLLAAVIFLFIRWRSGKLIREKHALEELIREKTAEVVEQKEEIEQASRDLAFKNEELERINNVVKSINAQINFTSLLESILQKMMIVRGVEKATALVLDKASGNFRYQTGLGWDMSAVAKTEFPMETVENTWLAGTAEVAEDIFITDPDSHVAGSGDQPASGARLVIVIKIDLKINGLLILETSSRKFTFDERDLSFIINLKQHLISAFIKTGLLEELQVTLNELKSAQDQLIQSEKLASLGQLTAGIAHEIQNPLNFVINFSNLSEKLAGELKENIDKIKENVDEDTRLDMEDIAGMIASNVQKIRDHGKRAESIVKGMLQHSRGRSGEFEQVDINNMVSEYVNLAYHGMRAKDKSFNTAIVTSFDPEAGKISMVPQDVSRVILNIVNNACYAVDQRAKVSEAGYRPEITVSTRRTGKQVEIRIRDNGTGIPKSVVDKIFNPFFTTKPTGQGTGLGLSMSFDIISQIHKGKLEVNTEEGEFTEFVITLPEKQPV